MSPPTLLAEDSVAVGAQLQYVFDALTTAPGIAAALLAAVVVGTAVAFKRTIPVMSGLAMYFVTYQLNPSLQANTLVGPLQATRLASKSIAFGLLLIAMAYVPSLPRPGRRSIAGASAIAFLCFQLFYALQFAIFAGDGLLKGAFGIVAMCLMFGVFAWGFGKSAENASGAAARLETMTWAGMGFLATNLIQIALDPSGSLMAGRLAGTAGNAQMMGGIAAMFLLSAGFQFASLPPSRPLKWMNLLAICMLGALILATGSRTAALATIVGLAVLFRSQLGKFSLIAVILAFGYVALSLVFADSARVTMDRFAGGQNTREAGWTDSLAIFSNSPVFGEFPFLQPGEEPNGIESTFIRTLANMGLVGAAVLLVPVLLCCRDVLLAIQLARAAPEYRRICDFYLAACASLLVLNTFDGYAFGFMTFPVVFTYTVLAVGGLLAEKAKNNVSGDDDYSEVDADAD
jgi:hypothetical protein